MKDNQTKRYQIIIVALGAFIVVMVSFLAFVFIYY